MRRHLPYIVLVVLSGLALVFALTQRTALEDLFTDRVVITQTTPMESISGSAAGVPVAPTQPYQEVIHKVERGESWSTIARKYGIDDYNELARYHDFVPLRPGMRLEIPAKLREEP